MDTSPVEPTTIDEYIAQFAEEVRDILQQVREAIRAAAPEAEEAISYKIPTFRLEGRPLVYFAGYRHHIGLYPVLTGTGAFEKELAVYRSGKGTMRFPLKEPIPYDLITRVVQHRLEERNERGKG